MPTPKILTEQEMAAELLRRRKMRGSLVGFAESIAIPGAPIADDADEEFELGGAAGGLYENRITTLRELDPDGVHVAEWSRQKARARMSSEYEHLMHPVGSSVALHHRILMEHIQECMETPYGRLMVFMPPGSAKSTYVSVVAPAWYMGMNPGAQIILASYATPIAKKHGSRGRLVVDQPCYRGAFGTGLDKKTQAKEMWALENGSEYMSGGLLSGLTGNRADGVLLDDPVKGRQAADSKTEQQRTREAYEDDLFTRMKPKAWLIGVQTRWNILDWAGGILPEDYNGESGVIMCRDGMPWTVLNIPGKCEHEDDPLGREIGEYLWPEWFDERFWEQYEPRPGDPDSPNERRWASLIQQRPRPDSGNMFEEKMFNRYDVGREHPLLNKYVASDYATQDGSGDFTEHGCAGLAPDGHMWIVDWFYGQVETDVGIDRLLTMAGKHGVKKGFGESGIIRHAIEPAFRRRKKDTGVHLAVEYLPNAGAKTTKLLAFQSLANSGKVWIPRCDWGDRLISDLCDFPNGKHDDGPDVCGLFGRAFEHMRWSRAKVQEPEEDEPRFGSWEWLTANDQAKKDEPRYV